MSDLVDRIDELVDAQLQQEPSGYDHNINQDKCPHCGRDWHGLPVTQRIADMYARRTYDEAYSLAEDDSPVLCEGSDFIGPTRPDGEGYTFSGTSRCQIQAVTIGSDQRPEWLRRSISAAEEYAAAMMLRADGIAAFTLHTQVASEPLTGRREVFIRVRDAATEIPVLGWYLPWAEWWFGDGEGDDQ